MVGLRDGIAEGDSLGLGVGSPGTMGVHTKVDPCPVLANPELQTHVLADPCDDELGGQAEQVPTISLSHTKP